jgi:two-component system, OmpR family, response regulator RegX3
MDVFDDTSEGSRWVSRWSPEGPRPPSAPTATVLLIASDHVPERELRALLQHEGYEVVHAVDDESALRDVTSRRPDLVVILVGSTLGSELCRQVRARSEVPILVLSSIADSHHVIASLDAGADDYVTAPIALGEVSARLRALLRRARVAEHRPEQVFNVEGLELRLDAAEVRLHGRPVQLTKTEFKLLAVLARHAGKLVTRDQLLDEVWGAPPGGDQRLVDTQIRRLRHKVESDPANPTMIVTVRGLGYKLAR